jgi:transcriptional regulator with XRE-family HTH domain
MLDAKTLGERLRMARERNGIPQARMGSLLGLDETAISKIEHGTRAVAALELHQLAAAYGVSSSELLGESRLTSEDSDEHLVSLPPAYMVIEQWFDKNLMGVEQVLVRIGTWVELCQIDVNNNYQAKRQTVNQVRLSHEGMRRLIQHWQWIVPGETKEE